MHLVYCQRIPALQISAVWNLLGQEIVHPVLYDKIIRLVKIARLDKKDSAAKEEDTRNYDMQIVILGDSIMDGDRTESRTQNPIRTTKSIFMFCLPRLVFPIFLRWRPPVL
mgnify:CR=1 FL=1